MTDHVIEVKHVYKTFGAIQAVKDLSFQVEKASCFSLLGPNGAGKTTMMKMLYGKAIPDTHGDTEMSVYGFDPRREELQIKYISGMVQQEDSLDEDLNVLQNLRIFAKYFGIPLTHPVRLTRALSMGTLSLIHLWDLAYMLIVTFGIGAFAAHRLKKKLVD
jgi:lipooligosaccharide transport system ATP-binding protein